MINEVDLSTGDRYNYDCACEGNVTVFYLSNSKQLTSDTDDPAKGPWYVLEIEAFRYHSIDTIKLQQSVIVRHKKVLKIHLCDKNHRFLLQYSTFEA